MSSDGKDEKLAQFQDVTGVENERASFFLESANWDLGMALGSFYESDGGAVQDAAAGAEPMDTAAAPPPPPAAAAAAAPDAEAAKPRSGRSGRSGGGGVGANVNTVHGGGAGHDSDESDDDDDDDDEDQGQAFYAGGSTTSGQQILGPPKKKGGSEFVKDLFKRAREHGAEAVDPSTSGGKPGGSGASAFTGTGFKLGSSESAPTEKVEGAQKPKPPREFVLKMWRNGFSIDEGELRPYNDPENRAFLAAVMTGRIPDELVHMAQGGEVHVDMEDHKEEEYVKPKGARRAFTGSGHVLGGIAPGIEDSSSSSSSGGGASASQLLPPGPEAEKAAQAGLKLDESQPTASIQVRLPDGKRLVVKVNHAHTVADVRQFVGVARPDIPSFSLHTTFPPKELSNSAVTVKDAGLIGAAILLRQK